MITPTIAEQASWSEITKEYIAWLHSELLIAQQKSMTDKTPFTPPEGQLDSTLWYWRCRAEIAEAYSTKSLADATAMKAVALKTRKQADKELETMGRRLAKLETQIEELKNAV
jgi:predicted ribosome quality control (RQC) complex YloA/Tae2 family protein